MTERLLSLESAAAYLDVDPVTIRRYIGRGIIPGFRVGLKLLRVRQADLDALVQPVAGEAA